MALSVRSLPMWPPCCFAECDALPSPPPAAAAAAPGIAIKLTLGGSNQLVYPETYAFMLTLVFCLVTQMNYLNKSLDLFNTAVVSPIYYVMFTVSTIVASMIMFRVGLRSIYLAKVPKVESPHVSPFVGRFGALPDLWVRGRSIRIPRSHRTSRQALPC